MLNDPLRVSALGVKHDYNPKLESHKQKNKRYYPQDGRTGEVDEWEAITRHQKEIADELEI